MAKLPARMSASLPTIGPYVQSILIGPDLLRRLEQEWGLVTTIASYADSDNLQATFTALLRHIPNATQFHIGEIEEQVASSILASLGSTARCIEYLSLKHITDCRLPWTVDGTLDALDLSKLRGFDFLPRLQDTPESTEDVKPHLPDTFLMTRSGEIVNKIVKKCANTLEVLSMCHKESLMLWPPPPIRCQSCRNYVSWLLAGTLSCAWGNNGLLQALDLSTLEELDFMPTMDWDSDFVFKSQMAERTSEVMTLITERCADKLNHLSMGQLDSHMEWPSLRHVPPMLPKLAYLGIRNDVIIHLSAFASLLRTSCPVLSHLELAGTRYRSVSGDWCDVWTAVREHPSRLLLDLDCLMCVENYVLTMMHHTGEKTHEVEEDLEWEEAEEQGDDGEERPSSVEYSLAMYVSGVGPWDDKLREWFDASWHLGL